MMQLLKYDGLLLVLAIYLVHHVTAYPANQRSHRSIQQHERQYPEIISNMTHLQCSGSVSIDLGSAIRSDTYHVDKIHKLKVFCPLVTNHLHQLHEILLSSIEDGTSYYTEHSSIQCTESANTSETHAKVQIFQRLIRARALVIGWLIATKSSNRPNDEYKTLLYDIRKTACKLAMQNDVRSSWKQVVETLDLAAYSTPGQSEEHMLEKLNKVLGEGIIILRNHGFECSPRRSNRPNPTLHHRVPLPLSSNSKQ